MYIFILWMWWLKIRMKYDFTRIVPSTKRRPVAMAHWYCAGGNVPKRRLVVHCATGMAQPGYEFLIPTSGRRVCIWGGRCPTLAFQSSSGTAAGVAAWRSAPHLVLVHCWYMYWIWLYFSFVLLFDFNVMFVLPNFIMLIKFVKLYYCVFPEFILIHI